MLTGQLLALNSLLYKWSSLTLVKSRLWRIKKTSTAFLCLVFLLCSLVITNYSVNLANAQIHTQTDPTITIASDGSVVGTDKIQRQGNVYTLTGDIFELIKVEKDGITIDGAGYAIKGIGNGINLKNDDPQGCGDVVVKNVRFCEGSSIFATSNGNSFINNRFEGGRIDINGGIKTEGKGNIIKHNIFIDCPTAIAIIYSNIEVVSENDFINCKLFLTFMGRFIVDKNYWSDYTALYPDAKEIEHTGVWDTPYRYDNPDSSGLSFVDNRPSVNPTNGAGAPEINDETVPVPTTDTPVPTIATGDDSSGSLPIVLIIIVVTAPLVIVSVSLLIYFKKRK